MAAIDATARIEPGAAIGHDVSIGPYCVIGPHVVISDGCRLVAHVHVAGHTTIGAGTVIYPFASLGTPPQSVKYLGGPTQLTIGPNCDIRESVTMNRGSEDGGGLTEVGSGCFFMVGSHVAHDCHVGDNVTFANNATLGGHVTVGDNVFLGGLSAVHQFARIGEGVMIGGVTGVRGDVIPFAYAVGDQARIMGVNVVGMKRRGYSRQDMHRLRRAYRMLFSGSGTFRERVDAVSREFAADPVVGKVTAFLGEVGERALVHPPAQRGGAADLDASP
ncbi:MAG: acyl-ACP--UDP-N-acetylglucosamine O-acyltransferase [Xanthobacteraceae bacterium]